MSTTSTLRERDTRAAESARARRAPWAGQADAAAAHSRRPRLAFGLGAIGGLALALTSVLTPRPEGAIPADAVATVNGTPIRAADLERAVAALTRDRRDSLAPADRRLVLDRLIDEELLVQRARALGLDRRDRSVRTRLVATMIDAVVADAERPEPSPAELAAFHAEHVDRFVSPARLWLRHLQVGANAGRPAEEASRIARDAAARLRAGEEFTEVARALGDPPLAPLPDAPLPFTEVRQYLGPSLARRALALAPGEVSEPVRSGATFHVLQLVARENAGAPPLASIANEVRAEMRRRADDRALRAYLDDLRGQATIAIEEP